MLGLMQCSSSSDDEKDRAAVFPEDPVSHWLKTHTPEDSLYKGYLLEYWDLADNQDTILPVFLEVYGLSLLRKNAIDSVYHHKLLATLRKQKHIARRHELLNLAGTHFDRAFLPDSAILLFDQALNEFGKNGKDSVLEMTYMYKGLSCYKKAAYTESLIYLNKALETFSRQPEKSNIRTIKSYIGNVYMDLGDDEKASEIYAEVADLLIKEKEFGRAIINLSSLTNIYSRMKDTVRGLKVSDQALALADSIKADDYSYFAVYLSRAHIMRKAGRNNEALGLFDLAVQRQKNLKNPYLVSRVQLFKVELLAILKRWPEAKRLLEEIKPVAKANNSDPSFLMDVYGQAGIVDAGMGNYEAALEHTNLYNNIKDSINVQEQAVSVAKLEKQFETKEKDLKLKVQAQERETASHERNNWILFAVLSLIASGSVISLVWVNRKRKLQQREAELKETFHQELIIATENEQSRIAMDLHDGISADLLVLKNKLPGTADVDTRKSIDEIIQDVRMLTRRLYPVQLMRAGICYASRSLIQQLDESTNLFFSVEIDDSQNQVLSAEVQLYLFRIIQEALSNAVKHSGAEAVYFEISRKESFVFVKINDNGTGFDWNGLDEHTADSLGVRSMHHRAGIINASFNMITEPGKGTCIELLIPVS